MKDVETNRFSPEQFSPKKPKFVLSSRYEKWSTRIHVWQPPTDLYETTGNFVVQVEIAGMREAEFAISLDRRTLMIKGTRNVPNEARSYFQMEISSGEFLTVVELPGPINHEEIEAHYSDGFLKVLLPKAGPSQVDVKT